ncbi:MAG: polyprenyl synthetase family protein [Rubripirellula sp.]
MSPPPTSSKNDLDSGISDLRPIIESALEAACDLGDGCPERLAEAMKYALLAPGKRLRPGLVLMAAECCDGGIEEALPGAVSVEMIHAYSLIHDDLPAMDDDDLRRGRPTVHVKFDEATAILAGDALLTQAFVHLSNHAKDAQRAIEAVRVLSVAAGASRLVGGQADDLAAEKLASGHPGAPSLELPASRERNVPLNRLEHLESIHRRKTGALFSASIDLGAVLVGADFEKRKILGNYARDLGLAFQVVDDLLDFTAESSTLGKRAGKDADRGKLTYPGLLGLDAAREKAEQLIDSASREVAVFGTSARRLTLLASYVLERTH